MGKGRERGVLGIREEKEDYIKRIIGGEKGCGGGKLEGCNTRDKEP